VLAVYAVPEGESDRYAQVAPMIRDVLAPEVDRAIAQSAEESGGNRRARFVHDGSCRPQVAKVVVGDDPSRVFLDLYEAGMDGWNRKYLVWLDAPAPGDFCGIAEFTMDDAPVGNLSDGRPGHNGEIAITYSACWGGLVETHELLHTLGAVQFSAPNSTPYGHCTDQYDVLCYDDDGPGPVTVETVCPFDHADLLDCNHDDYFSAYAAPGSYLDTHWNIANSVFLIGGREAPTEAPPNESFGAAAVIPNDQHGICEGTLTAASCSVNTELAACPSCNPRAGGSNSVWFSWRPGVAGVATADTFGSDFNTVIAIYIGTSLSSLRLVAGDDDAGPERTSVVDFAVAANVTYRILAGGAGAGAGNLQLDVEVSPGGGPANDGFQQASPLPGAFCEVVGHVIGCEGANGLATPEPTEPAALREVGGASVWYTWESPLSTTVRLDTEGSSFDTVLGVFKGSALGSLATVAFNDDATPGVTTWSRVSFRAVRGVEYRIVIDGFRGATGGFRLTFSIDWCPGYSNSPSVQIVGTGAGNVLVGTPGDDVICGLGGPDALDGRGGNDVVLGGPGDDRLLGWIGNDRLVGGAGDDWISGEAGDDDLAGGIGSDLLTGGPGSDRCDRDGTDPGTQLCETVY
jgi:hypothetical protein